MLHNIFEKQKIKSKNKIKIRPRIIADIHEKDSMILAELKSNKDIELEIQSLKIGDYLIGNTIIERKTISDFISSMLNKRLIEQLNQMQQYKQKILIIEGELFKTNFREDTSESFHFSNKNNKEMETRVKKPSGVLDNAIRGFILSIITNYETNIIFTKDYQDTTNYLITLAKQQLKPKIKISLHSRIPKTLKEQKQYILEAFPNIGPKKAELLLKKFKTLSNIFNASEEELKEVLKNQSKNFKDILNF